MKTKFPIRSYNSRLNDSRLFPAAAGRTHFGRMRNERAKGERENTSPSLRDSFAACRVCRIMRNVRAFQVKKGREREGKRNIQFHSMIDSSLKSVTSFSLFARRILSIYMTLRIAFTWHDYYLAGYCDLITSVGNRIFREKHNGGNYKSLRYMWCSRCLRCRARMCV